MNAFGQSAGGGAASGGTASGGTASGGTVSGGRAAVSSGSTAARPGVSVTAQPAASVNNANLVGANGQPTTTTATSPNGVAGTTAGNNLATQGGAAASGAANTSGIASGTGATAGTTPLTGTTTTVVPFGALPAAVQSTIAAQLPAGVQVGSVVEETTANGTQYRAMVTQNGVTSEMTLSGVPAIASSLNGALATTSTGGIVPTTSGFVTGTPFTFEQLPAGVQSAFAAQASGVPVTNVTYVAGANGAGMFRGFANGKPIEIRTASPAQVAAGNVRTVPASTNDVRVEDLPAAVRDAVKARMPYAEITKIRKADAASGALYDLTLRNNDASASMQVSENGTIVRETRNLALELSTESAAPVAAKVEPPKLTLNTLPPAVRDSIETHVDPTKIKTLVLTNYESKPTYTVDYVDGDGFRNRLYLNKQGLITKTDTNIYGVMITGRAVTIDDLPQSARTAIQTKAGNDTITRIDLDMRGLNPVYVVTYAHQGENRQMVVTPKGVSMDAAGAPPSASTGEEPPSLKELPSTSK